MIEYALHGPDRGEAVILCHSTGGGYDQGLVLASLLKGFKELPFRGLDISARRWKQVLRLLNWQTLTLNYWIR